MAGAALIQEVRTAIGYKQQADLATALLAANMWSLRQTNNDFIQATPVNEDDTADLGKGVYAENVLASHMEAGGPWNARMTSENMALLTAFGLGKITKASTTATGGFKYTGVAPTLATDGLDMPPNTLAVQIRTSTDAITDKAIIGVCCEEWGWEFTKGKGRDNALMYSTWVGTGKSVKPSTIVIPAVYVEHGLNAGGITALTLLGYNYLTNKRFVGIKFTWKNNIRDGFYPGSGNQSGYQIQGRMRRGVPQLTLTATVECDSGSNEEDTLLAQTEGTGVVTCLGDQIASGPESHQFKTTFQRLRVKTTKIGDSDGIAAYNLDYSILRHTTNGVLTTETICTQDNILAVAP